MSGAAIARWSALGTSVAVMVTDAAALDVARRAVEAELADCDRACSRFRPDSELSRVNAHSGHWVTVGPLLAETTAAALRVAELTGGAVDPTVGEALILAGYDRDFTAGLRAMPPPLVARRVPGWQAVRVAADPHRVRVERGVRLDLGATAKALAADRGALRAALAAEGTGVLVNLGGDIAVAGPPPAGGWRVFVTDDHRSSPGDAAGQYVAIESGGLATSSTAVRRWGPSSHHIIDPATGAPADSPWRTASVAAATCVDANAASTAAIVLGEEAQAWLAERKLPARLVTRAGEVATVADWPAEVVAA